MGRKFYLNDAELHVINEALTKWENWAQGDMTPDEEKAIDTLMVKGVYSDD